MRFVIATCLIAIVGIVVWGRLSFGRYKVTEIVLVTPFTNALMSASFRQQIVQVAPNIRRVTTQASTSTYTSGGITTSNPVVIIMVTCAGPSTEETKNAGLATAHTVAAKITATYQVHADVLGPRAPIQKRRWSDDILDVVNKLFNR